MDLRTNRKSMIPVTQGGYTGTRTRAASGNTRRYCTINLSMPPAQPLPTPSSFMNHAASCPSGSESSTLVNLSDGSESELVTVQEDMAFPQPPPLTPLLRRMQSEPSLHQVDHTAVYALLAENSSRLHATSHAPRHPGPFPEFPSTAEELDSWVGSQQDWLLCEVNDNLDFSWEAETPDPSITNMPPLPPRPSASVDNQFRQSMLHYESPLGSISSPLINKVRHRHSTYATNSRYVSPEPLSSTPRAPQVLRKMTSFRQNSNGYKQSCQQLQLQPMIQRVQRPKDAFEKVKFATRQSPSFKGRTMDTNRHSFITFGEENTKRGLFHRPQKSLPQTLNRTENSVLTRDYFFPRPRPVGVYGVVAPTGPRPARRLTKRSQLAGSDSFIDMGQDTEPRTHPEKARSMIVRASISLKKGWNKALMKRSFSK